MTQLFDLDDPAHEKALGLLRTELIAWFTTVGEDGTPHAVPVWFFWHDDAVWIITRPDTVKVAHVRRGSRALVHLNTQGDFGADVVVLTGSARVVEESATEWVAGVQEAYLAKYAAAIDEFGMPLEALLQRFSAVVRMAPEKLLTW
jgi:PPOX class probable F420-dependent enzyme